MRISEIETLFIIAELEGLDVRIASLATALGEATSQLSDVASKTIWLEKARLARRRSSLLNQLEVKQIGRVHPERTPSGGGGQAKETPPASRR